MMFSIRGFMCQGSLVRRSMEDWKEKMTVKSSNGMLNQVMVQDSTQIGDIYLFLPAKCELANCLQILV